MPIAMEMTPKLFFYFWFMRLRILWLTSSTTFQAIFDFSRRLQSTLRSSEMPRRLYLLIPSRLWQSRKSVVRRPLNADSLVDVGQTDPSDGFPTFFWFDISIIAPLLQTML